MMTGLEERERDLLLSLEELRERNRQLLEARSQAATDALTGLLNHRAFQERIREDVRRGRGAGGGGGWGGRRGGGGGRGPGGWGKKTGVGGGFAPFRGAARSAEELIY